jgi:putative FmdB family regulatory protein
LHSRKHGATGPAPEGRPFSPHKNTKQQEERMPTYEYACDSCYTIYQTRHGINDARPESCPECKTALRKVLSAPSLNTRQFTSPTEAKYANLSVSDEIAKEADMQKIYKTIWLPPEVKHSPWDDDH